MNRTKKDTMSNRMNITRIIMRMMMMATILRNKKLKHRMIGMKMDKNWKHMRMKMMEKVHKIIRIMPNNSMKKENRNRMKEVSMAMSTVRNSLMRNTTKHSNITRNNSMTMKMKLNISKANQRKKSLRMFHNTSKILLINSHRYNTYCNHA